MTTYEPEKITIIEGPPPLFDSSAEPWVNAIGEGPVIKRTARCVLRTFDGLALLERCRNAWSEGRETLLEYRAMDGLRQEAVIVAARADKVPDGDILLLWVKLDHEVEMAIDDSDADSDVDADDSGQ